MKSAQADLLGGYRFYERQKEGLGNYFIDSLSSDIESLKIYAGIHSIHFGKYYRFLSKLFLLLFIIELKKMKLESMLY